MNEELINLAAEKLGKKVVKLSLLTLCVIVVAAAGGAVRVAKWEASLDQMERTCWRNEDMGTYMAWLKMSNMNLALPDPADVTERRRKNEK